MIPNNLLVFFLMKNDLDVLNLVFDGIYAQYFDVIAIIEFIEGSNL